MKKGIIYAILLASILVLAFASSATAATMSVAASDSASTTKSQADLVCSGSNDRTQITSALTSVSASGGGTVYLSEGTFKISTLSIPANVILQGEGSGSTLLQFASSGNVNLPNPSSKLVGVKITGPAVVYITASHVTVQDVALYSKGLRWAAFCVEKLSASSTLEDIEFRNCQAIDCDTTGFMVSAADYSYVIQNLRFIGCRAVNCGASGQFNPWVVGFDLAERASVDGMLVDGCYASGSYESGFHFESSPSVKNAVLRNCVSENNGLSPTALWGAGYVVGEGTVLENCKSSNNQYGYFIHTAGFSASGCVDTGSDTSFIMARYMTGCTLTNVGSKSAKETALTALDQSNLRVTNLVVENCLGSTPVLAPRATSSVVDWHYGSVSTIGSGTVPTPTPTPTAVQTTVKTPTPTPTPTQPTSTGTQGAPYPAQHNVPGRVEAEDYDVGGFYDTTATNDGGAYRNDAVDIEAGGSNYDVAYIRATEYLQYSVDTTAAGTFTINLRIANPGAAKTVTVYVNGAAKTLTIPATGSFETWQTASLTGVSLKAGRNLIKISMGSASSFNMDYMDFASGSAVQTPTTVTTSPTPTTPTSTKTASIKFTSTPSGGKIYIDGEYKGVTPATVPGITLGVHRAEIQLTGYKTWVKSITVTSAFLGRVKPYSYNPTLVKF